MPVAPSDGPAALPRMAQKEKRKQREKDPGNLQHQNPARPCDWLQHCRTEASRPAGQPSSAVPDRVTSRCRRNSMGSTPTACPCRGRRPGFSGRSGGSPASRRRRGLPRLGRPLADLFRRDARANAQHTSQTIRLHAKSLAAAFIGLSQDRIARQEHQKIR
jgi:hypothetical protein